MIEGLPGSARSVDRVRVGQVGHKHGGSREEVSQATVDSAFKARKVKSLLSPVVTVVVALCTAFVLWRGAALIVTDAMTIGALTVFLAYLSKFFKPVQDLAKMTNAVAQTHVGLERIQSILGRIYAGLYRMAPVAPDDSTSSQPIQLTGAELAWPAR